MRHAGGPTSFQSLASRVKSTLLPGMTAVTTWATLRRSCCVAVLACVGMSACASDERAPDNGDNATVTIAADGGVGSYTPADITVGAGAAVVWRNASGYAHNVIFADTSIDSSRLFADGEEWTTTFPAPGTYPYHCSLHPTMTGVVTVDAAVA